MMGRHSWCKILLTVVLLIAISAGLFLWKREEERETGYAQGYEMGFSIGYTDSFHSRQQNAQKLAGKLVSYEPGSAKWKYFIMGFAEGYDLAQTGEEQWLINES